MSCGHLKGVDDVRSDLASGLIMSADEIETVGKPPVLADIPTTEPDKPGYNLERALVYSRRLGIILRPLPGGKHDPRPPGLKELRKPLHRTQNGKKSKKPDPTHFHQPDDVFYERLASRYPLASGTEMVLGRFAGYDEDGKTPLLLHMADGDTFSQDMFEIFREAVPGFDKTLVLSAGGGNGGKGFKCLVRSALFGQSGTEFELDRLFTIARHKAEHGTEEEREKFADPTKFPDKFEFLGQQAIIGGSAHDDGGAYVTLFGEDENGYPTFTLDDIPIIREDTFKRIVELCVERGLMSQKMADEILRSVSQASSSKRSRPNKTYAEADYTFQKLDIAVLPYETQKAIEMVRERCGGGLEAYRKHIIDKQKSKPASDRTEGYKNRNLIFGAALDLGRLIVKDQHGMSARVFTADTLIDEIGATELAKEYLSDNHTSAQLRSHIRRGYREATDCVLTAGEWFIDKGKSPPGQALNPLDFNQKQVMAKPTTQEKPEEAESEAGDERKKPELKVAGGTEAPKQEQSPTVLANHLAGTTKELADYVARLTHELHNIPRTKIGAWRRNHGMFDPSDLQLIVHGNIQNGMDDLDWLDRRFLEITKRYGMPKAIARKAWDGWEDPSGRPYGQRMQIDHGPHNEVDKIFEEAYAASWWRQPPAPAPRTSVCSIDNFAPLLHGAGREDDLYLHDRPGLYHFNRERHYWRRFSTYFKPVGLRRTDDGCDWKIVCERYSFNDDPSRMRPTIVEIAPSDFGSKAGKSRAENLEKFGGAAASADQNLIGDYLASIEGLSLARSDIWKGVKLEQITDVPTSGWIQDIRRQGKMIFALPNGSYSEGRAEPDESIRPPAITETIYETGGTLEAWSAFANTEIVKHTPLRLVVLQALSGPLVRFSGQPINPCLFLVGNSGKGKSLGLFTASAVWGKPQLSRNPMAASGTSLALERLAALRNDTVACFDELTMHPHPSQVAPAFYSLAHGTPKAQGTKNAHHNGGLVQKETWKNSVILTGEEPIQSFLERHNLRAFAGVEVRWLHVDIITHRGVFDGLEVGIEDLALQSYASSFADANAENYGHAGRAFAAYLTQNYPKIEEAMPEMLAQAKSEITEGLNSETAARAAGNFAILIVAGRLARDAGIIDWTDEAIISAVRDTLHKWANGRFGSNGESLENRRALEAFSWLVSEGASKWVAKLETESGDLDNYFNEIFAIRHRRDDREVLYMTPTGLKCLLKHKNVSVHPAAVKAMLSKHDIIIAEKHSVRFGAIVRKVTVFDLKKLADLIDAD